MSFFTINRNQFISILALLLSGNFHVNPLGDSTLSPFVSCGVLGEGATHIVAAVTNAIDIAADQTLHSLQVAGKVSAAHIPLGPSLSSALSAGPTAMEIDEVIHASIVDVAAGKSISLDNLPEGIIVRPVAANHDGITQGNVGSCHIFATQAMMKDATGLTVSAARMFLDHLIHYGKYETVDGTERAISGINMNHILKERTKSAVDHCGGLGRWEGGYIQDNLQLMQVIGGVIVPNNEDYKEVVALMNKLDKERMSAITSPGPLLRSANAKLQNGGLQEIIQKAISPVDSSGRIILADRGIVMSEAQKIRVQDVTFFTAKSVTVENMKKAIEILVKKLETNAIYLAVDSKKYWQALYLGKHLAMEGAKYSERADHAIVLVGYEMSAGVFFIMDSNNKAVVAMDARDLVLSTAYAAIFKKRA